MVSLRQKKTLSSAYTSPEKYVKTQKNVCITEQSGFIIDGRQTAPDGGETDYPEEYIDDEDDFSKSEIPGKITKNEP